jgi:two-component sensor histidine kinase
VAGVRARSPARLVVAAAAALIVAVFAVLGMLTWQAFEQTFVEARSDSLETSDVLASKLDWAVGASRGLLGQFAAGDLGDRNAAAARFAEAVALLPDAKGHALYDLSGRRIAGTAGPGDLSAGEFDIVGGLAAPGDWMVTPQLAADDGAPQFLVVQHIVEGDAGFLAAIAFGNDLLESVAMDSDLGEASTLVVVRDDGWLIARQPPVEESFNANASSSSFGRTLEQLSGSYEAVSSVDGRERIIGYTKLEAARVVAYATISRTTLTGRLWYSVTIVSLLMAPIALALFGGALWTARLLNRSAAQQQSLQQALDRNQLLFNEIHHRVKNNLQSVSALVQLHPIDVELKREIAGRLTAMSAVHEQMYRSGNFETVRMKDYLHTLLEGVRSGNDPRVKLVEDVSEVEFDRDRAGSLGLIVNEILTNAFKHAFAPEAVDPQIRIAFRRDGENAVLEVIDNGRGFDPKEPVKGIGRRLIGALTAQLRGTSGFEPQERGSLFRLTFPFDPPGVTPVSEPGMRAAS